MEEAAKLAAFFWSQVAPLSIQAAILLPAAFLLDRLLPPAVWPELRLAAGSVLLLKLTLPPTWASPIDLLPLPGSLLPALPSFDLSAHESWRGWAIGIAMAWLFGVLAVFGLALWRQRRLAAIWDSAWPADAELDSLATAAALRLGLRRAPALRISPELVSPCVFGLWRARILLPPDLPAEMAEHALLHELAHVRRGDLLLAAFFGLLRALYFFHPLVHLALRRLQDLRELCCDRFVARALGDQKAAYRRTLLSFAARRHAEALGALPFAGRSSLLERLRDLERAERDRPLLRRGLTSLAAALVLACAVPVAPQAERGAARIAEWIEKPPGCLQLRFLVMERMAAEQQALEKAQAKEQK